MTLHQNNAKKAALAVCGTVAVGLGAAGIFLPLLPTTPFLLLAAACFFRSSDRLYNWLINHKWFGHYIKQYREHKAISRQTKLATLLLLWGTLAFSALLVLDSVWARILLLAVGIGVSLHVLGMKTLK
jgi:uncharacterized membrane protein YbaN (DUF454 family)